MTRSSPSLSADRATPPPAGLALVLRPAVIAAAVGLAAFIAGPAAEGVIIRAVRGNRSELEWISDALISLALVGIAYLWLHLRASRQRLLALERQQIVIGEQLRLAAEIQRNLLPDVPQTTPGFRWAAQMVPAGVIGGDFYDFVQLPDGAVVTMLADVSGKGIPAALILSSLKTLFQTTVRETTDPGVIAERISAALHEENGGVPYTTGIVGRFDRAPGRLAYVNAGHPAGCLLRNGTAVGTLDSGGPPLGLFPGVKYSATEVALAPGDLGVMVTDGVTEALDAESTALGGILCATLRESAAGISPAELCGRLLAAAARGPGPAGVADWQDDRSVFVFRVEPDA
jgi:sigma-B regulation protein RsbU (phosphoserine phosphatase)